MSTIDELLDLAREDVDSGRLPACQLAVAKDGELVVFETFGSAGNDTRFCVYSCTKPIVASAIWLLLADGSLALDDTIASHIPEFGTNGKDVVTLEQVLLHTSGFPNVPIGVMELSDPVARLGRFGAWRLEWVPGSRFEYHHNSAHIVLIELIERCTGTDFRDAIESMVCRPLGLPRVIGIPGDAGIEVAPATAFGSSDETLRLAALTMPEVMEAGSPAGGAIMTAAELAGFYQGLLHNPGGLWDAKVLKDATSNIRCTLREPLFDLPVNRSIGLVIAGDDGQHFMRYAGFGPSNSPGSFGHAGAFMQIGWADPATGISFAYCHNGLYDDMIPDGARGVALSDLAASLDL